MVERKLETDDLTLSFEQTIAAMTSVVHVLDLSTDSSLETVARKLWSMLDVHLKKTAPSTDKYLATVRKLWQLPSSELLHPNELSKIGVAVNRIARSTSDGATDTSENAFVNSDEERDEKERYLKRRSFDLRAARDKDPLYRTLSARERDVVLLLAQGMSAKQVASTIRIAEATVIEHMKSLRLKWFVCSTPQMLARLRYRGLI